MTTPPVSINRTPWWSKRFATLHTRIGHCLGAQRTLLLTTTVRTSGLSRTSMKFHSESA